MEKIPLTKDGYSKLEEELRKLKANDRPNIIKAISEARELGDLSENAEYHSAREKPKSVSYKIHFHLLPSIWGRQNFILFPGQSVFA